MNFKPHFLSTHIGSVPHTEDKLINEWIVDSLDIPAWLQLPRLSFNENIYVQFSRSLPFLTLDETNQKIIFNMPGDSTAGLEEFYTHFLADDVDYFALTPDYARGFFNIASMLKSKPGQWVKGQVMGPISFGLMVTDQNLRASLYNNVLEDVIVKNMVMNARWQARQLQQIRDNVIIFVDEPYMASYGSAFISLERNHVMEMLNEVFSGIQSEGALAGLHCCGNTDWSVLLSTCVDILNLDVFDYMDALSLYPVDLRKFLDRGGIITWGIIPTNDEIRHVTASQLADRLIQGMELIIRRAKGQGVIISMDELSTQSLISPSCGLGTMTVENAELVLHTLVETTRLLK